MTSNLKHQFQLAKKQDRMAQKFLYEMFSPKMLSIAKSYVNSVYDAEDILIQAFYKAFTRIEECRSEDSFGFWLRKIVVNDSINFIRKNKNLMYVDSEFIEARQENYLDDFEENLPEFNVEEVLEQMPIGYKLVFNLYIFEDKKHQEIAEILNISEGTSKSQLNKAKKWLAEFFKKKENEKFIKK